MIACVSQGLRVLLLMRLGRIGYLACVRVRLRSENDSARRREIQTGAECGCFRATLKYAESEAQRTIDIDI